MSKKEGAKGCMTVIVQLLGIGFAFMAVEAFLGFLFGGKSFISEFLDPDSEGTNLSLLRFAFWALVVAIVIFFMVGGKIKYIFGKNDDD
jgi:hypothetical protein